MEVNSPEPTLYSAILLCVCFSNLFDKNINDIIVFNEKNATEGSDVQNIDDEGNMFIVIVILSLYITLL